MGRVGILYCGVVIKCPILIIFRLFNLTPSKSKVSQFIFLLGFFHFTMFGWLLFRANSFALIFQNINAFFVLGEFVTIISRPGLPLLASLFMLFIYEIAIELKLYEKIQGKKYSNVSDCIIGCFVGIIIFLTMVGNLKPPAPFIYFQF